jgi:hypothetical protein
VETFSTTTKNGSYKLGFEQEKDLNRQTEIKQNIPHEKNHRSRVQKARAD